jgi:hypothetical protein
VTPVQWQCRCLRIAERIGLAADKTLIDKMELGIGALRRQSTGIEHIVTGLEQAGVRTGRNDPAGSVPAEHPPRSGFGFGASPHLGVDRIDRDCLHLDQQFTAFRLRLGQVDIDKGGFIGDGGWDLIADGAHFGLRDCC